MIQRNPANPLVKPTMVKPSRNGYRVRGAFNPAAAELDGEIILVLRIAEDWEPREGFVAGPYHRFDDGRGYPDRLKGEEIPIGAQIIAVADSFDAMTSSRPYRKGLPPRQAKKEITVNTGSQFSPKVGQAFEIIFEKGLVV